MWGSELRRHLTERAKQKDCTCFFKETGVTRREFILLKLSKVLQKHTESESGTHFRQLYNPQNRQNSFKSISNQPLRTDTSATELVQRHARVNQYENTKSKINQDRIAFNFNFKTCSLFAHSYLNHFGQH